MSEIISPRIFGVAEVNYYLKQYLADDPLLESIAIKGEVAGFRAHSSGHWYFSLKEKDCQLKTVMFRRYTDQAQVMPHDGMEIVVFGSLSLYERDGVCQLYAEELYEVGGGAAAQALRELSQRLAAEGLFDEAAKQPLPRFAESVGVVTSAQGAAWADIQRIAYARWPQLRLVVYNTLVQGDNAPAELAAAIALADGGGHDILIVGRGGGAAEDLAAFNSEQVVRAIHAAHTPLISAVGHETDATLADLAADVRAATPSHAAQLAVPEAAELRALLEQRGERLRQLLTRELERRRERLMAQAAHGCWTRPLQLLEPAIRGLDEAERRLTAAARTEYGSVGERLSRQAARLQLLSPLATLARGYALAADERGVLLRDSDEAQIGQRLQLRLRRGELWCRVEDKGKTEA
ncbi:MAG: exodeoxyribonuclease VII large subunit [Bacillota bacterium]|nr:exodeoxyribonuclease VII large subunit [Bacillota bacterium]